MEEKKRIEMLLVVYIWREQGRWKTEEGGKRKKEDGRE